MPKDHLIMITQTHARNAGGSDIQEPGVSKKSFVTYVYRVIHSLMNTGNITTYLTDHLAGSVAALELLNHLIALHEGREDMAEIQSLKTEVEADQQLLQDLLGKFGVDENAIKKAGAWMAEKALMVKVKAGNGDLGLLEALEVLVLGIEGKLRLWHSLECVDIGLNLPQLQATAANQIQRVETLRRQAARKAFWTEDS